MKRFSLTSPAFDGEALFEYGDDGDGLLRQLTVPVDFGKVQHAFLMSNLPATVAEMRQFPAFLKEINSPATVREVFRDVTFDDFWKRYFAGRASDNSSKKKAKTRWDRMSRIQQQKAFEHIPKYLNRIPQGVGIKLAETYLNSDLWN
jgi:hypothetical protein